MKTLDKEGVQYTLQRMVTLLAAIQEKVNASYPEYKEGTFIPKFFNFSGAEQTFGLVEGYYKKIGNLCYIFIVAQTDLDVSVTFINNFCFLKILNVTAHSRWFCRESFLFQSLQKIRNRKWRSVIV